MLLAAFAAGALHLAWPDLASSHLALSTQGMRRRSSYKIRTKAYNLEGWDMRIEHDGFTGQVRCRLFSPSGFNQGRISYAGGVLGFHLDADRDVSQAWYSVDDRPPQPWRDDFPALVVRRVSLEGGSLVNPTGGVVLIPFERLAGGRTVTIRADQNHAPKRFRLRGFERALAAAKANGCADATSFERDL